MPTFPINQGFNLGKTSFTIGGGPKTKSYKSKETKTGETKEYLKTSDPGMEHQYDWKAAGKFSSNKKQTPNYFKLNVGKGQGYNRKGKYVLDRDAPGGKYGPGYEPPVREEDKGGAPFKLASGNTTPFKMMGSSPAQFFGGLFGGGGGGGGAFGGIRSIMDRVRAKREARRNKRLGIAPKAPGGGDGSHTHGGGGEAIGGAQAVTAQAAAPEMPAEAADEEMVA